MKEHRITPARWPEDCAEALRLLTNYGRHLAASPVGSAGLCLVDYGLELRGLPEKYAGEQADLLLARVEAQSAGCAAVTLRTLKDNTQTTELKRLWVEPAYRGCGVGRGLVVAAMQWARAKGCQTVVLDTVPEAMPEAIALYRSMGFEETERFNNNPISGVQFYILKLTGDQ